MKEKLAIYIMPLFKYFMKRDMRHMLDDGT